MTKEELKNALKDFGSKGKEIAEDLDSKIPTIETQKEELDTQTRREVRKFWIFVSAACLVIGYGLSFIF